jgi:hypothetical protein
MCVDPLAAHFGAVLGSWYTTSCQKKP